MHKILFLGSKKIGFYCLEHLLEKANELNCQVVGIVSKGPAAEFGQFAKERGISIKSSIKELSNPAPLFDFIISVQHHEILNKAEINLAKYAAINLHMAPLPEYRGCNQFSFAILDRVKIFGTTLHLMSEGIDSGDIIFERRFNVPDNAWIEDIYNRCFEESLCLFKESLPHLINLNFTPLSQKNYKQTRNSQFHLRKEIDQLKVIDLNWDAEQITKHIRATYMPPFEPPHFFINNEKIYFVREQDYLEGKNHGL